MRWAPPREHGRPRTTSRACPRTWSFTSCSVPPSAASYAHQLRRNGNDGPGHSSGSGIDGSGPSSSNNSSATIRQNKPSDSKTGAKAGRGNGSLYASGFLRAGGMKDSDRKSVQFSSEPGKTAGVGEEDPVPDPKDLILVSRADLSQIVATHFKESLEAFSSKKKRGSITLGTAFKGNRGRPRKLLSSRRRGPRTKSLLI